MRLHQFSLCMIFIQIDVSVNVVVAPNCVLKRLRHVGARDNSVESPKQ